MKFNGIWVSKREKEIELMWLLITIVAGCNHWKSRCKTEKCSLFIACIHNKRGYLFELFLTVELLLMCTVHVVWVSVYLNPFLSSLLSLSFVLFLGSSLHSFAFGARKRKRNYNVGRIERLNVKNSICSNNNSTTGEKKNQLPACDQCTPWPLWW